MNSNVLILFLILVFSPCYGQSTKFKDISEYDSLSSNFKLLYFHFDRCPPCKKMDTEVFSDSAFVEKLTERYDLYSIYNFGPLEQSIRDKYRHIGDPGFIVLDKSNMELHRFIGFYEANEFHQNLENAHSNESLSELEKRFSMEKTNTAFLKKFIKAKEKANQVDSNLIVTYLNALDLTEPVSRDNILDIAHYGYFKGDIYFDCNSKFYEALNSAYTADRYPDLTRLICNRLIFSLDDCYYRTDVRQIKTICIMEMEQLEHGEVIALSIVNNLKYAHAAFTDYYPSFRLKYILLSDEDDSHKMKLLNNHFERIKDHPKALNEMAWNIYIGEYSYSTEEGLKFVKRALELERTYNSLDTYAALLYKQGSYIAAEKIALEAVELAENKNLKSDETQKLLKDIRAAMNE